MRGTVLSVTPTLSPKFTFPDYLSRSPKSVRALVDFSVVVVVLLVLMAIYRVPLSFRLTVLPFFLVFMVLTVTGIALWFSALSVKYRDCTYALPYFTQLWFFLSAVVYPLSLVPEHWRPLFALNPAVGFIEGFRWAVLGHSVLTLNLLCITVVMSLIILFSGAFFFRRAERGFADII